MKSNSTASASRRARGEHGATSRASGPPPPLAEAHVDALHTAAAPRSYQDCYRHFVKVAAQLPDGEVIAYPGDARLALANVRLALSRVCADPAAVAEELPKLSVREAAEAADVARAVVYIDARAASERGAKRTATARWRTTYARCAKRRRSMLGAVAELADKGLLPAENVAVLGHRAGVLGVLDDADILCELFSTHAAAIAGQHPYSAVDLASLRSDVEWLRENTTPKGARKPRVVSRSQAALERDRLWTLLVRRHALLQRIAGYFHGADAAAVVLPLRSRVLVSGVVEDGELPVEGSAPPAAPARPERVP